MEPGDEAIVLVHVQLSLRGEGNKGDSALTLTIKPCLLIPGILVYNNKYLGAARVEGTLYRATSCCGNSMLTTDMVLALVLF